VTGVSTSSLGWERKRTMGKPQALIIEDHEDSSIIFANALQEAGFECEIIRAGDKALAWLAETTPAVVILDLELPRVSGVEILRQIRADARLAKTHVIITTAFPDMAVDLEEKADLVLIKPVSYSQLRDLAKRVGPGPEPSK
jgi:DNA-binding response OmpR family regulator